MASSRLPGFFRLAPLVRRRTALEGAGVSVAESPWGPDGGLSLEVAETMIENVVGTFALPNGVAVNLLLNGKDHLVPMVVEEPSVVAAVSNMARLTRAAGGVTGDCDESVMIGQVQLTSCPPGAADRVRAAFPELTRIAEAAQPQIVALGGGIRGMEVRELRYEEAGEEPEEMLVLHFFLDCLDAMGANMVNAIAERLAPELVALTGGKSGLRILSNLADRRVARARVAIPVGLLSANHEDGLAIAEGIAAAWRFAWVDPWRAATHNKGIMNGVDAVAIATGNDWRAIEAGAHAYAARSGQYRALSTWRLRNGVLIGELEMPMQVGTVSGAIRVHPSAKANLALAGVSGARELSVLMAAVGLIQNLGALRALATEGIQEGHMRMHARAVATGAGADPHEIEAAVRGMVAAKDFTVERAATILSGLRE
jgi:hydroxymethylglutaryl-CoA reductase